MARFLLLLAPEHPLHGELSAGELGRRLADVADWLRAMRRRGVLRAGARLAAPGVRIARTDTDPGRWEQVGSGSVSGCLLVEAEDLEAAAALARECPLAAPGGIEVFELDLASAFAACGPGFP